MRDTLAAPKREARSAKPDVSKVLFPDIGKITNLLVIYPMSGNNATLKMVGPLKIVNFNLSSFKRCPHDNNL